MEVKIVQFLQQQVSHSCTTQGSKFCPILENAGLQVLVCYIRDFFSMPVLQVNTVFLLDAIQVPMLLAETLTYLERKFYLNHILQQYFLILKY
jgi:hypothetical protein